jgi:DNA sulfur modification protein DndE
MWMISFFPFSRAESQARGAEWYITHAPFAMTVPVVPVFAGRSFSVADYGGVGDGHTLNTRAFAKAIAACSAAGGGRVLIPRGSWLTGPIQLQSNVDLHAERGALVIFTSDHAQYPMIRASAKSNSIVTASPIYGYDLQNIAITGEGIFDGAGETWRPVKKEKTTLSQWKQLVASGGVVSPDGSLWWPTREAMDGEKLIRGLKQKNTPLSPEDLVGARDYLRPYMVYLVNCHNILLENITLRNSPKFVFYPSGCTSLTMRHVQVFNEWWAQNGDGIDISQCRNVLLYRCTVSAGDDGICMKSGSGKNDPSHFNLENIVIAECNVYHAHGGFVIGSNTDGGMQNIFVDNCRFIGTDIGVRVKSNAGRGGLVKNIFIRNIYMKDIQDDAISFDTYYENRPAGSIARDTIPAIRDKTPRFSDFYFDSVYCNGASRAISITGLPEMPVSRIHFKNMILSADRGMAARDASDLYFEKVKILSGRDPVYVLDHVRNITVTEGYLPSGSQSLYKADPTSTGIRIAGAGSHQ